MNKIKILMASVIVTGFVLSGAEGTQQQMTGTETHKWPTDSFLKTNKNAKRVYRNNSNEAVKIEDADRVTYENDNEIQVYSQALPKKDTEERKVYDLLSKRGLHLEKQFNYDVNMTKLMKYLVSKIRTWKESHGNLKMTTTEYLENRIRVNWLELNALLQQTIKEYAQEKNEHKTDKLYLFRETLSGLNKMNLALVDILNPDTKIKEKSASQEKADIAKIEREWTKHLTYLGDYWQSEQEVLKTRHGLLKIKGERGKTHQVIKESMKLSQRLLLETTRRSGRLGAQLNLVILNLMKMTKINLEYVLQKPQKWTREDVVEVFLGPEPVEGTEKENIDEYTRMKTYLLKTLTGPWDRAKSEYKDDELLGQLPQLGETEDEKQRMEKNNEKEKGEDQQGVVKKK